VIASGSVPGDGSLGSTFVLELLSPKTTAGGTPQGPSTRSRPPSAIRGSRRAPRRRCACATRTSRRRAAIPPRGGTCARARSRSAARSVS
jgi:hypothetical protein